MQISVCRGQVVITATTPATLDFRVNWEPPWEPPLTGFTLDANDVWALCDFMKQLDEWRSVINARVRDRAPALLPRLAEWKPALLVRVCETCGGRGKPARADFDLPNPCVTCGGEGFIEEAAGES